MVSDFATLPPRRTPLYTEHLKLGAKMINFGGWKMPVFYSSILEEHQAVRQHVGIFDISHMGQIRVSGPSAVRWLNTLLTNDLQRLKTCDGQYTLLLNEQGGVLDDLIVYFRGNNDYFLVVNAAKIEEDFDWMQSRLLADVALSNLSDHFAALAVQGPASAELLRGFGDLPIRNKIQEFRIQGIPVLLARTGYTGEDGFELFYPAAAAAAVWNQLLVLGVPLGVKPCGLGARDTLRMEVCYPLNGADLSPLRTPLEAGLGFFVDLKKSEFVGRSTLLAQKEAGLKQRLVALKADGKSPPLRAHYAVFVGDAQVGELTSGTQSPSLGIGIGLGYVDTPFSNPGQKVEIDVRGRRFPATVEKKPLYKKGC
ncbi:MAG: glycine cleavage system aminomethyltransferase GcvT [Verrucomicrobia bacterium]|nr:glycine cleavage system aminomethyltransferase GcvT [Verrucomicrobiota bacterium]